MDAWLNPITGDYAADPARIGALVRDPAAGLANAVYLRLMTPLASWFGDPTLGSRLHELQREKDLARMERLAKQYSEQALQPLLNDGRARSITVSTDRQKDRSGAGRHMVLIEVVDARGQTHVFSAPVAVV
jgi:phage gp46-like protein